jgi:hypothetical protein
MSADPAHPSEETSLVHDPHDQAAEVEHAWHHFHENVRFFACFFSIVLLTVIAWNVNFGSAPLTLSVLGFHIYLGSWNLLVALFFAAARSALIAYFMATMFKSFSFVTKTFFFGAIFLAGMIFLSWWDSEIPGIGDPIKDRINPPAERNVP